MEAINQAWELEGYHPGLFQPVGTIFNIDPFEIKSRRKPFHFSLEPIREVWIHDEAVAVSRLSMMRIMARRTKAATVVV